MKTISQIKRKTIKSIQIDHSTNRGRSFLLMKFTDGEYFSIATKKDFNIYSDNASIKMNHTTVIECDYSTSLDMIGATIESVQIMELSKTTPLGKRKSCFDFTIFTDKGVNNYTIQSERIPEITDYELQFFMNGTLTTPEEYTQP